MGVLSVTARAGGKDSALKLLGAVALTAVVVMTLGAGAARAASCDTSWTGTGPDNRWDTAANWDHGVPTSSTNACITQAGDYTVELLPYSGTDEAKSLVLGGSSGTQTLEILSVFEGGPAPTKLILDDGGSVLAHGAIQMTTECENPGGPCSQGSATELDITTGTLAMGGTLISEPGDDFGVAGRTVSGNLINTGTIQLSAPLQDIGGTLVNDTGGSITNGGGTGALQVWPGTTFTEGGGTTSPSTTNPPYPAVIVSFPAEAATLNYTRAGASTIAAEGDVGMSGDLAAGQNLVVIGAQSGGDCVPTVVTGGSFTNAGTITEAGPCQSELDFGTLTNTGAIDLQSGATRGLKGNLTTSGILDVNGPTDFNGPGASLTQTGAGITSILVGQTLDLTGSSGTFKLNGGVLDAPGSSVSTPATISGGSLDNAGGNVIPGAPGLPGDLVVDGGYTQGPAGKLTATLDGESAGNTYSQLGVTSDMAIAGTLAIETGAGFQPELGHAFMVLGSQTGHLSGNFAAVTEQFPPEGPFPPGWTSGYQPFYDPHDVTLSVQPAAGLRVRRTGPGSGTVTSSPTGISCGKKCDAPFFTSQTVTLSAHPGRGWAFVGWTGACSGLAARCRVSMSQARTVTARFAHRTRTTLSSSLNPAKVGRRITYSAVVSPHPSGGTVRFTSGGTPIAGCGSVAVSRATGRATCSVTYQSKGSRRITAVYAGNASYARSGSNALTEVVK